MGVLVRLVSVFLGRKKLFIYFFQCFLVIYFVFTFIDFKEGYGVFAVNFVVWRMSQVIFRLRKRGGLGVGVRRGVLGGQFFGIFRIKWRCRYLRFRSYLRQNSQRQRTGSVVSFCGYGEKYYGLRRCRFSSMYSMFFIRVTMSSWFRSDIRFLVMRGVDGILFELFWEFCLGLVEDIRLQKQDIIVYIFFFEVFLCRFNSNFRYYYFFFR